MFAGEKPSQNESFDGIELKLKYSCQLGARGIIFDKTEMIKSHARHLGIAIPLFKSENNARRASPSKKREPRKKEKELVYDAKHFSDKRGCAFARLCARENITAMLLRSRNVTFLQQPVNLCPHLCPSRELLLSSLVCLRENETERGKEEKSAKGRSRPKKRADKRNV